MGGWVLFQMFRRLFRGPRRLFWSGCIAAWLGVVLSSISCAALLTISGVVSWRVALSIIVGVHAVLGLGEGLVTGGALESLYRRRPDLFPKNSI